MGLGKGKIMEQSYYSNQEYETNEQRSRSIRFDPEKESLLLKKKSIAGCVILVLITFGFYGVYWKYTLCKKIKILNHDESSCFGEMLCLYLVPFYSFYWAYNRGYKMMDAASKRGVRIANNSTLYLILDILLLNLVVMIIMQSELNNLADNFEMIKPSNQSNYPRTFSHTSYDMTASEKKINIDDLYKF